MPTYNEVLKQAQSLSMIDQFQLLKDLQKIVSQGVKVEGSDEVIPADEIAESEAALADYLAGRDLGKSLKQVELELFGRELD